MKSDEQVIGEIRENLAGRFVDVVSTAPRRISLKVAPEHLVEATGYLKRGLGFAHLCTISGVDLGDAGFEIIYHLANSYTNVNLRTVTPRDVCRVPTVTGVIGGAILYEREIQEMFGVTVENIPDPRRLNLPDDWPAGVYPFRKDFKVERRPEVIPGGK